ncbi:hypothetical protein D2917_03670 [Cupriavidus oxalaticus]|uniref:Uncharacterized protein n=1 Tax=Cupriavidus oxalaticus TaxID=96344 RepID=A0A5P3VAY2_9BURK|nr:hypothetical protein D2917_03670 [Cupriavidus oxalaticus]
MGRGPACLQSEALHLVEAPALTPGPSPAGGRGEQTMGRDRSVGSSAMARSERSDAFCAGALDLRCCRRAAQP